MEKLARIEKWRSNQLMENIEMGSQILGFMMLRGRKKRTEKWIQSIDEDEEGLIEEENFWSGYEERERKE